MKLLLQWEPLTTIIGIITKIPLKRLKHEVKVTNNVALNMMWWLK